MELHAQGLERIGHASTVLFSEDVTSFDVLRSLRLPGLRTFAALRTRYARERPDLINVHTQCAPAWIAANAANLVSSPIVVMSYAADEPQLRLRGPRDLLRWAHVALAARCTYPRAQGIWCVNQQDVEYYVSAYGVRRDLVRRFPHAVADSFYVDPGARSPRRTNRLLFVGTWLERKGVDVLARALRRVVAASADVEIVLAGTICGEEIVRRTLHHTVSARTRIVNRASDAELADLYRSSALLLIPSRQEGLPITMLEAMVCGCPALAAANSGMLDVIVPDRNGWLEVSFDDERWASRILELLATPDRLASASVGALATGQEFRVDGVARKVVNWYERLIETDLEPPLTGPHGTTYVTST